MHRSVANNLNDIAKDHPDVAVGRRWLDGASTERRALVAHGLRTLGKQCHPDADPRSVLVDLRVHFVKANGSPRPKVFKGTTLDLDPGTTGHVRKSVSLSQHTTRTHDPGRHHVEALVNGDAMGSARFTAV